MNIVGKRSGEGFVAHKDHLANALSRAQGERVTLFDGNVTLGRKGFYTYLKALAGSNIVKVVPANGNASGSQVNGKGVKVVCGSHESYLPNGAWLKDKMPLTFSQVCVSPSNAIMPNLGGAELAEALSRVVVFASTDDKRPILQTVRFYQREGKLILTASDGFKLGEVSLDFEDGEGEALILASELRGLISALRKAKRVKVSFEAKPDNDGGLLAKSIIIDTELVRYQYQSQEGTFPDYGKVIPSEFVGVASFDTKEAVKAIQSLLTVWYDDKLKPLYRPITLTIAEGKVLIEAKEERGKAEIKAESSGEGKISVNGKYLLQALKACGGIADLHLPNAEAPMLFTVDGYRCVVMPMETPEAKAEVEAQPKAKAKRKRKAKREAKAVKEAEAVEEAEEPQGEVEEPITSEDLSHAEVVA